METSKYIPDYRLSMKRRIQNMITRYEVKIKEAKGLVDETPTGYFQKGRERAYQNVVLDLMRLIGE